jgi:hypothetical protein
VLTLSPGSSHAVGTPASATATIAADSPTGPATPVTIRAAADTYVRDGTYAKQNFGAAADLQLKNTTSTGFRRESYLRFPLTGVASVASAKLRLYARLDSTQSPSSALAVYGSSNTTWAETSPTWNTRLPIGTAALATGSIAGTAARWYEIDLTSYVQQQRAAGATAVTFVLQATSTVNTTVLINSDEATANRPELVVTPAGAATPQVPQGIVLSTTQLTVPEGSSRSFGVALAAQPATNVTVNVARNAGSDPDLTASVSTLTFTPTNWSVQQQVAISAAQDADATNGTATFTLSSAGLPSRSVTATEADDDVATGTTTTLRAAADAYVRDGSTHAAQNFGLDAQLQLKRAAAGWNRESFLRFDVTSLTSVSSAKLRLYGKLDNTAAASVGFTVQSSGDTAWGEQTINWNNRPVAAATVLASGSVVGMTAAWYELDLTSFLQQQRAAGAASVTLVLKAAVTSDATILFDSDEAAANRPELRVVS